MFIRRAGVLQSSLKEWNTGLLRSLPIPWLCIIIFKRCFREELITAPTKWASVVMVFIVRLMILGSRILLLMRQTYLQAKKISFRSEIRSTAERLPGRLKKGYCEPFIFLTGIWKNFGV